MSQCVEIAILPAVRHPFAACHMTAGSLKNGGAEECNLKLPNRIRQMPRPSVPVEFEQSYVIRWSKEKQVGAGVGLPACRVFGRVLWNPVFRRSR